MQQEMKYIYTVYQKGSFSKAAAALCVFAGVWLVTKSKSRAQVEAEAGMKKG